MSIWLKILGKAAKWPLMIFIFGLIIAGSISLSSIKYVGEIYHYVFLMTSGYILAAFLLASICWFIFRFLNLTIAHLRFKAEGSKSIMTTILSVIRNGLTTLIFLLVLKLILPVSNLPPDYLFFANKALVISLIILIAWLSLKSVLVYENIVIEKYQKISDENMQARSTYTRARLLKQLSTYLILILTLGACLLVFDDARKIGISIMTSVGFITVILGFAARGTLSTLFTGLQITLTQPFKIGDSLVIDNELGTVEEISLTTIVVRLWDLRRLIIPVNYLLNKPIQNWTHESQELLGTIFLYVDYMVPIEKLRAELEKILKNSTLWDQRIGRLDVTECKENALQLRVLLSSTGVTELWDLRCEVREKLVTYLSEHFPEYLPKVRITQLT
ncbi:MAG: mechanosensitive ion channel family protein [Proteobacteria bacterium]|nr:mechanosensitive ion channel family protein [Pseudomonadota bacterium]